MERLREICERVLAQALVKGFSSGERGFEKGAGNAGAYDSWKAEGGDDHAKANMSKRK